MAFPWLVVASLAASAISKLASKKKSSDSSSSDASSSSSSSSSNNFGTYLSYANGIKNLLSDNSETQYNYQKNLLGLQNNYAVNNATTAYNRQRSLMLDSPVLNLTGLRSAGINPATAGGTTANAASVNQANAGSTPSGPDVNGAENTKIAALQVIQQAEMNQKQNDLLQAQKENVQADTESKTIDNKYKDYSLQLKQWNDEFDFNYKNDTQEYSKRILYYQSKNAEVENEILDLEKDYKKIINALTDEQRKQAEFYTQHQAEEFINRMNEIKSKIKLNNASALREFKEAALAEAQTFSVRLDNQFKQDTLKDRELIVQKSRKLLTNQVVKSYNDAMISAFNNDNKSVDRYINIADKFVSDLCQGVGTAFGVYYGTNMLGNAARGLQLREQQLNKPNMNGYSSPTFSHSY